MPDRMQNLLMTTAALDWWFGYWFIAVRALKSSDWTTRGSPQSIHFGRENPIGIIFTNEGIFVDHSVADQLE